MLVIIIPCDCHHTPRFTRDYTVSMLDHSNVLSHRCNCTTLTTNLLAHDYLARSVEKYSEITIVVDMWITVKLPKRLPKVRGNSNALSHITEIVNGVCHTNDWKSALDETDHVKSVATSLVTSQWCQLLTAERVPNDLSLGLMMLVTLAVHREIVLPTM